MKIGDLARDRHGSKAHEESVLDIDNESCGEDGVIKEHDIGTLRRAAVHRG